MHVQRGAQGCLFTADGPVQEGISELQITAQLVQSCLKQNLL